MTLLDRRCVSRVSDCHVQDRGVIRKWGLRACGMMPARATCDATPPGVPLVLSPLGPRLLAHRAASLRDRLQVLLQQLREERDSSWLRPLGLDRGAGGERAAIDDQLHQEECAARVARKEVVPAHAAATASSGMGRMRACSGGAGAVAAGDSVREGCCSGLCKVVDVAKSHALHVLLREAW